MHRTGKVLRYVDGQFVERMLAMDSIRCCDWADRSPDLNPLDYFVWGYLKDNLYRPKPRTMAALKDRIRREMNNQDNKNVWRAVKDLRVKGLEGDRQPG